MTFAACVFLFAFFFVGCLCCGGGCAIFSDDFNRSNSSDIGSNWTEATGNWSIASNKLSITATTGSKVVTTTAHPDSSAQSSISAAISNGTAGDTARPLVDYQDASNYHFAEWRQSAAGTRNIRLGKVTAGVETILLTSGSVSVAAGQTRVFSACVSVDSLYAVLFTTAGAPVVSLLATITPFDGQLVGLGTGAVHSGTTTFDDFAWSRTDEDCGASCPSICQACEQGTKPRPQQTIIIPAGYFVEDACDTGDCSTLEGSIVIDEISEDLIFGELGEPCGYSLDGTTRPGGFLISACRAGDAGKWAWHAYPVVSAGNRTWLIELVNKSGVGGARWTKTLTPGVNPIDCSQTTLFDDGDAGLIDSTSKCLTDDTKTITLQPF